MSVAGQLIGKMCRFVMRAGAKIDGVVIDFADGYLKVDVYRYIYELGGASGTVFIKQDKTIYLSFEDISTIEIIKQWSEPPERLLSRKVKKILNKAGFLI